ncbi:MAG: ABC transporter ATP-binding protein [Pseudomonadales bacterium]|nr:ABC transporter ATP-binding protein [Pseudomonadales bacterium]
MKSLAGLLPFIAPYKRLIGAGFLTFFIARFFEVSSYYLVALGLDTIGTLVADEVPEYGLGIITIGIIVSVLMRFLFVVYARRAVRRAGMAVSYDLRQKLYSVVQRQGSDFFARMGIGDIMTRAIQDISLIQRLVAFGSIQIVIMVYAPLYGVSAMMYKSSSLTLMIVPILPAILYYGWWMSKSLAETSQAVQQGLSDLSAHVQENLSGIRTVQAMAQEENEITRFWVTNNAYGEAFYDQARVNSLMSAWMPFLAAVAQLMILTYGGNQVLKGEMTVGDLVFFLACLNMLLQPIRMAGMFANLLLRGAVATRRLYEIFDSEPEIADQPSGQTPAQIRGEFEIRHLSYTYPRAAEPVLKDVSLRIRAGESVAIVGRVGSGKSTLLKMFTRMLDTPPGTLFLDGHDIRDYPLKQIRREIAQVLQDPFLFGEPLRNNISYDDPERHLDVIWDSAEAAALRSTIEEFPLQMETLVGERGVTLSGGQKQRATLARGLIRQAPVLILDDCFSSVDTETEEHILSRLKQMRSSMTTILVSHRVSTLRHADRIVVLQEGEIVETGSHEELLRLNGIYAELERAQTLGSDNQPLPEQQP